MSKTCGNCIYSVEHWRKNKCICTVASDDVSMHDIDSEACSAWECIDGGIIILDELKTAHNKLENIRDKELFITMVSLLRIKLEVSAIDKLLAKILADMKG